MKYILVNRKVQSVLVIFLIFIFISGACNNKIEISGKNTEKNRTTTDKSDDDKENGTHIGGVKKNGTDAGDGGESKTSVCTSKMALTFGMGETTPTTVGYANTAFKYFYYHKDNKIYYSSRNSIYKMDLDGSSVEKLKDNDAGTYTVNQYVYVYKDAVYYNNAEDKKIYTMKTDGTNHAEFVDGYGEMRIYGDRFFYFVERIKTYKYRSVINHDLMSIQSESTTCKIEAAAADAFHKDTGRVRISGGNFHVKDNTIYFHNGDTKLYSVPLGNGGASKITVSSFKYDNYVFADNVIYFRWHSQNDSDKRSYFGLGQGMYDTLDSSPSLVGGRDSDEKIYEEASLNASSSFLVYVNRIPFDERNKKDGETTRDVRFVSSDGSVERVLVKGVRNKNIFGYPRLKSEVKIIGDWVYYMVQQTKDNTFEIHRVKKDGTEAAKVQTIY